MIDKTMRAVAIAMMLATLPGEAGAQILVTPPTDAVPDPLFDLLPLPPKKNGQQQAPQSGEPAPSKRNAQQQAPQSAEPAPSDRNAQQRTRPAPQPAEPAPQQAQPAPQPDRAAPSARQIERQLEAAPRIRVAPERRVTIREFKRRPDLRRAAPSIDIQAINFAFGSAEIPVSQYRKIENIATAIDRLLDRRPDTRVLIEGHTDAVGSFSSNQILSERRAASLKRTLVREFGIPPYVLETVGYGEEFLLVPTSDENWQNRRVTLRRIDDFVRN